MKATAISIIIAAVFIGGAIMLAQGSKDVNGSGSQTVSNVSVIDGKQVIAINAKGSYSPTMTTAKAGMPSIIKVNTKGTFDCTSALTIPSLGYRKNLPPSGETEIEVPPQKAGATLQGLCGMGMYNFQIRFN